MKTSEMETTVAWNMGEEVAYVYSCVVKHVSRMLKDERFTLLRDLGDGAYEFTISRDDFDAIGGLKKRLSQETRQKMSENAKARFASS